MRDTDPETVIKEIGGFDEDTLKRTVPVVGYGSPDRPGDTKRYVHLGLAGIVPRTSPRELGIVAHWIEQGFPNAQPFPFCESRSRLELLLWNNLPPKTALDAARPPAAETDVAHNRNLPTNEGRHLPPTSAEPSTCDCKTA